MNNRRRIELLLIDTLIIAATYFMVSRLAMFGVSSLMVNGPFSVKKLLAVYLCIMGMRILGDLYGSIWRYANVTTYLRLMICDSTAGVIFFILGRIVKELSLGFAYSMVLTLFIIFDTLASRFVYQFLYAHAGRISDQKLFHALSGENLEDRHKINVAIVGAGNVGASLAEELLRNPRAHYYPYCFIDKDVDKIGNSINGIHIFPEDEYIVEQIKSMPVQEIVIALPDASLEDRARLYQLYKQTNCKVKLYDYPLGDRPEDADEDSKRTLREFSIEDLLFRDSIVVSNENTKKFYQDKVVLVTGGGGSIGSELCRQIAALRPKKLVILDIYENNAYDIQQELVRKYHTHREGEGPELETVIASVRDEERIEEIFAEVRPDIVFHAAAHKHVPLMEYSGCEAIKNNVFGTYHVANMAEKYGTQKFLLISTDKAVNPTNIMGASKRLCEMIIQCRTDSRTEFTAVRFGNVLGSNGSVIPLFKRQIEAGGPVTLTDKRIIRYFMTISEAVGLVMETGAMAHNGELFVLDMGKPVKILELAENMIRLSGFKPYEDIDIREIGLRPGEKLYEELLMKSEKLDKTENELIFIERDKALTREEVEEKLRILTEALQKSGQDESLHGHHDAVLEAIKATVPTYHDPEEINRRADGSVEMQQVNGR